ncbi:hypothetical protein [Tunicatimonas pelagia]|uniref:hypothetical protein n=1 Tax=Tunicatimonas pelagia TaxID=931531 RepID=UPI002666A69B|nr:hypothetical protein [Tunicatimonas pelagia]WKN46173.1 hypothetical protein P0M28_14565 [Tunicatimonas pelagia]
MKTVTKSILLFSIATCIIACNNQSNQTKEPADEVVSDTSLEEVLTAEEQAALIPDEVISLFREGNQRFISNDLTARNHSKQVRKSTYAQYPKAIVLSCVDNGYGKGLISRRLAVLLFIKTISVKVIS